MSNENKEQALAEELMDFLAAGKEARRVGGDSAARDTATSAISTAISTASCRAAI